MFAPCGAPCAQRVAIITGGSSGLGREITRKLALASFAVVVTYARDQGMAEAAVEEVLAANGAALAVRADIADALDVERVFTEAIEAFGGVDVLVHAASRRILGPVADPSQRTNFRATSVVNREASRHLRDGGAIVNLSGTVLADAASTAALEAVTRELAHELRGRHITVNAVVPGLESAGVAAATADVVAFLVSSHGHCVSGEVLCVDEQSV